MMDLKSEKFVILEIIPTAVNPANGEVAQLSALKINGLKLEARFDYRLEKSMIKVKEINEMTNYDNDAFTYLKSTDEIMKAFKNFCKGLPLLIIDNDYTRNYLSSFRNKKESVFKYLNLKLSNDVFETIIKKYSLEASNHLVDLLYEALMMEFK